MANAQHELHLLLCSLTAVTAFLVLQSKVTGRLVCFVTELFAFVNIEYFLCFAIWRFPFSPFLYIKITFHLFCGPISVLVQSKSSWIQLLYLVYVDIIDDLSFIVLVFYVTLFELYHVLWKWGELSNCRLNFKSSKEE